jgi:hypothetical protein
MRNWEMAIGEHSIQPAQRLGAVSTGILPSKVQKARKPEGSLTTG